MRVFQSSIFRSLFAIAIGIFILLRPDSTVQYLTIAIGVVVFLVLRNGGEKPVGFDIPFAALGLDGRVAVLDLVEMAELDLDAKSLKVEAPPSGERKFCLVAWPAAGGAEEGRGGAG